MKDPKRCISHECQHRDVCEYAKIQERTMAAFPDFETRSKYGCKSIRPVARACDRWKLKYDEYGKAKNSESERA